MDQPPTIEVSAVNTRVRFEQWAKNPTCDANTVSAVLNVPMGDAAVSLGYQNKKALPPFAIARGLSFEKYLFENNAEKLTKEMRHQKMVSLDEDVEFIDYRHQGNLQKRSKSAERSRELSTEYLNSLVDHKSSKVTKIISGLTIKLAKGVMLPEATLILDCLLVRWLEDSGKWYLKVGEIKIFPDRGGYTDPNQISSARAQAGVYKHALDEWLAEHGVASLFDLDDHGFLVFTWPGSNFPVVRPHEDLRSQADRAKSGFERMDQIGHRVILGAEEKFEPEKYVDWVTHSQTNFREACWEFCDLAPRCQDQALSEGRGIFLGTEPSRALGSVTISRALELLNGSEPQTDFENELLTQLIEAESGLF